MKVYKLNESAEIPAYATEGSACFDLQACFKGLKTVTTYNPANKETQFPIRADGHGRIYFQLHPQYRSLIPTGLIFSIQKNHAMRIYPRSGLALKKGLILANGVAMIDNDYVEETFVMVTNVSDTPILIYHGDRVAQAEIFETSNVVLEETKKKPHRRTSRKGGLGSTGT